MNNQDATEMLKSMLPEKISYANLVGASSCYGDKCVYEEPEPYALELAISALAQQLNNGWIPVSERLPQLPDGKSFMPLNATILAPSGLRNTVQMTWELKRGKPTWCYLGGASDWNVIAWRPLPEPWEGEEE